MKMAATYQWSESNGAGEVVSDNIVNVNFGSVDDKEIVTADYPITREDSSFEKYIRGLFSGVFTEISNIKFWRSDVNGYKAGETLKAAANVTYAQPSATPNADSDIPLSEGTALAIKSAEGADTIEYGASGVSGYTGYVRLQLNTTIDTPSGSVFTKTVCLQYDEV
jgi:hypothetical protein